MKNPKSEIRNPKLSKETVKHVAKLAQLSLTDSEIIKFQKQLSEVLEYFGKLNEIDTSKVEPTSQITGLENVFRKDEVGPCLSQQEDGFFKTKAVFE